MFIVSRGVWEMEPLGETPEGLGGPLGPREVGRCQQGNVKYKNRLPNSNVRPLHAHPWKEDVFVEKVPPPLLSHAQVTVWRYERGFQREPPKGDFRRIFLHYLVAVWDH